MRCEDRGETLSNEWRRLEVRRQNNARLRRVLKFILLRLSREKLAERVSGGDEHTWRVRRNS